MPRFPGLWTKRMLYISMGLLPPIFMYQMYNSFYATDCDVQSRKRHMIIMPPKVRLPSREEQLQKIQDSSQDMYDVIVIGGGATGCGVALDAAVRGLKTLLLESDDFASGTSSKSTKLIHGGVRYLELAFKNLDVQQLFLVKEALDERENLMYIGPHLSSVLPILLPIYSWLDVPMFYIGLKLYDILAASKVVQQSEFVGRSKALSLFPILESEGLKGGVIYYDGLHNDARMNVSIALTAAHHGATVLNHVKVDSLLLDSDKSPPGEKNPQQGRVVGVIAKDQISQKTLKIRGKVVVNAAGVYYENIVNLPVSSAQTAEKPVKVTNSASQSHGIRYQVAPSRGTHISIAGSYTPSGMGVLNKTQDGRVIFLLLWEGSTIAGTTDEPCPLDSKLSATSGEVKFILREVSSFLNCGLKFTANDVKSAWTGIRPLLAAVSSKGQGSVSTKDVVRSHVVFRDERGGLVTVTGGKWTTYRQMAEDAVDAAVKEGHLEAGPCRTKKLMLLGGHDYTDFIPIQLNQKYGVPHSVGRHLSHSYGDRAFEVAELAAASGFRLLYPNSAYPFLEAEVEYAVREYACTAADVICRRTRLAFLDYNQAVKSVPRVVELLAKAQKWDSARKQKEQANALGVLEGFRPPTQQELDKATVA